MDDKQPTTRSMTLLLIGLVIALAMTSLAQFQTWRYQESINARLNDLEERLNNLEGRSEPMDAAHGWERKPGLPPGIERPK